MLDFLARSELYLPILLQGVYLTILVTLGGFILSTLLGLVLAFMRVSGIRPLSAISSVFVIVVRGIPALVTLFISTSFFPIWVCR